jgi:membrane-associated phospholipid phosphatase
MLRPTIKLRRCWPFLATAAILLPTSARAQQQPAVLTPLRYSLRAWPDAPLLVGGAALSVLPGLLGDRLPLATCAPCDPAHLWSVDRGSVGLVSSGPETASNAALFATVAGSAALVALTRIGEPDATSAVLEDAAIMAETAAVDGAMTQWLKVLVHRPRPDRYTAQGGQFAAVVEDSRSFPSGHASFAFAAAAAAASVLHRRGILHSHKLETVLLFTAATATSVLRVAAHRHFPTDVLAGALLGTAIGWTLPQLHSVR